MWGGIIWTARKAADSASNIEVGAEGFWSYARRRKNRVTQMFNQIDQATIAQALITYMNGVAVAGNIGIVNGSQTTGVLRDRTYNGYERQYIGELIEQLAAVESGFDFSIDVTFDGVSTFTKTFNVWYPNKGTRTGLTWEVGVHCDFNGWNMDATQMANQIDGFGAGEGDAMLISTATDPGTNYPLLESDVSYKSVLEQSTLDAHTADALTSKRLPSIMPALTLRPTRDTEYGTFQEGDEVRINGNDGFAAIDGPFRIMSYQVAVSDEGAESTAVTFQDAQIAY